MRRGPARAQALLSSVRAQLPLPPACPARDLVARCLETDTAFIRAASADRANADDVSDHEGSDCDATVIPDTLERPAAAVRRRATRADVLQATVRDFIADWRDDVARRDLLNAALEAAAMPPPCAALGTQTALCGDDVAAMAAAPAALAAQAAAELAEHAAMLQDAEAAHELDMADLQDMHQAELDRMEQGCRALLAGERQARAAAEAAAAVAQREAAATAAALRQSVADLSAQLAQVKATNEAAAKQVCDAQAAADAARADADAASAREAAALATRDEFARLMHCSMVLSQQCLGVSLPPAPDAAKTVRLALADVSYSSRANA
jgi:SWI/SNF-related matrix-associated actin-dependent regulator 1 of chromatin subfamily A